MRKAISFTLIIFIFFLVYQVGINYLKRDHSIEYDIETETGELYLVNEDYSYEDNDTYTIRLKDSSNNSFVFDVKNSFNKQREIVKEVLTYFDEDSNVFCISLKLVNDDSPVEPRCLIDNVVYSYSYIQDKYDITKFLDSITNLDYKKYKEQSNVREDSGIKVNKDYLEDRELIVIYDYKRVVMHNKINSDYFVFATSDNYKNTIGQRVGKYYLIPKLTENAVISNFIKYDLETNLKKEVPVPKISKQFYINGVYDDKLYVFDKSEMIQYSIDPYNDEVNTVSDGNEGIIYENGKEKKVSVYDLAQNEMVFTPDTSDYKSIDYDEIYLGDGYAIYLKNDAYYKVYKKYPNSPIYLFDADDVREIVIRDNNVYYVKGDSIYRYNSYGNIVLVTKNEFKFNSDNIYDVYLID